MSKIHNMTDKTRKTIYVTRRKKMRQKSWSWLVSFPRISGNKAAKIEEVSIPGTAFCDETNLESFHKYLLLPKSWFTLILGLLWAILINKISNLFALDFLPMITIHFKSQPYRWVELGPNFRFNLAFHQLWTPSAFFITYSSVYVLSVYVLSINAHVLNKGPSFTFSKIV